MRKILTLLSVTIFLFACQTTPTGDANRFRQGVFEIPAGEKYGKTIITRVDSLQIEEYTRFVDVSNDSAVFRKEITKVDTLFIKWKNNFSYILKMKSPKKEIDHDPIYVQITKVTDSSYNFSAKIGFSEFKQNGTVYKIK